MKTVIITSLISMLINPVKSPVSFQYPANVLTTPYGTCTWYYSLGGLENSTIGTIFNGMSFAQDAKMTVINYSFNGQATGSFDLPVYTTVLTQTYRLFVAGGILLSVPDLDGDNQPDALRFRVTDTKQFTCLIVHPNWSQTAVVGPSLLNQNITVNDTLEGTVSDILSYTEGINGYIQTINSNVNTIKNILTQSLGSYVSQGGSLYGDMQTMISAFQLSNQQDILQNIPVESMNAYIIFRSLGQLQTYAIDKMPYYAITSDSHTSYKPYLYKDRIYYISMRFYNPNNNSLWNYISIRDDNSNAQTYSRSYHDFIGNYSTVTISFTPSSTGYYSIDFSDYLIGKYVTPLYFGENTGLSSEIYALTHIPNKYTEGIQGVIDAVRNMALNVTNLTVNATGITYNTNQTQVDNSVTSYNNNISIVNNIENNFKDMFDNANQNYNVDNIPITNDMVNTSNFMNNVATQLYGIDIIKYPVTLLLLGIILIGLLG